MTGELDAQSEIYFFVYRVRQLGKLYGDTLCIYHVKIVFTFFIQCTFFTFLTFFNLPTFFIFKTFIENTI